MTRLIAVDASLTSTGIAVFDNGDPVATYTVRCSRLKSDGKGICPHRFARYQDLVTQCINDLRTGEDFIVLEAAMAQMRTTGDQLATARAIWETVARSFRMTVLERIWAIQWQQSVLGLKRNQKGSEHRKEAAKLWVEATYSHLKLKSEDEADAVCIGVYAHMRLGWPVKGLDFRLS